MGIHIISMNIPYEFREMYYIMDYVICGEYRFCIATKERMN